MDDRGIKVVFYQRKPRSVGNYSIEFIFDDVRRRLKNKIDAITFYSAFESSGLFKRLYNCLEAFFNQRDVNHVTGDINYLGLFLNKKRTIHTIHDCVFIASSSGLKRNVLQYFWLTVPIKRSKYITVVSEATKTEILRYASCDLHKIIVIPVAISERFVPKPRLFNKAKPVILQMGAAHNKNIPRLVEALEGLSCTLHIVGKQNEEYNALLKKHNIEYVYQSGLTEDEVIEKYAAADIVTLVSTYEGFGMPILEAQATGRPVITSNILSMPEVAGNAAQLADPYDVTSIRNGFLKVINDDSYRNQLIQNGFENIRRFNPDQIALRYYSLYKKVAGL